MRGRVEIKGRATPDIPRVLGSIMVLKEPFLAATSIRWMSGLPRRDARQSNEEKELGL